MTLGQIISRLSVNRKDYSGGSNHINPLKADSFLSMAGVRRESQRSKCDKLAFEVINRPLLV